jgi:hypothetical protein
MILIGLALPAIGSAMGRSRQVRELATLQQNVTVSLAYVHEWKDTYPLAHVNAHMCMTQWWAALVAGGYITDVRQTDPTGVTRDGDMRFWQSMCMTLSPHRMYPGTTVPASDATAQAITQARVTYPSRKGWMLLHHYNMHDISTFFCCYGPAVVVPAAMADGSCTMKNRTQCEWHAPEITIENEVGVPILSTWGGCESFDLP